MRRTYLKDSQPGDAVEDVFVITNKQLSTSSTGKPFIKAFVSDRSAQITARMWNAGREIFNAMPESGFVRVRGRVENYQGNLQFIMEQIWPAREGSFDAADLMPHTAREIGPMCAKLAEIMGSIQNRHLAAIVHAYLDDEKLMKNFCRAPAAQSFHHAYIGGLLEHTLNAVEVGDAAVRFYPLLNRDLVISGLFIHDIAKTWELNYDCAFGYTDGGTLIGHVVKGAIWVEQKAAMAEKLLGEKIPQALIETLQHICLSHHGKPDFGAARIPSTPEALFIHMIDDMDAKMMIVLAATRGDGNIGGEGNWTEYLKAFNGRFYRPDVAPAEAAETEPIEPNSLPQAEPPVAAVPTLKLAITNPLFEAAPPKKR
jgi:3'-5' exoribonuclease